MTKKEGTAVKEAVNEPAAPEAPAAPLPPPPLTGKQKLQAQVDAQHQRIRAMNQQMRECLTQIAEAENIIMGLQYALSDEPAEVIVPGKEQSEGQ